MTQQRGQGPMEESTKVYNLCHNAGAYREQDEGSGKQFLNHANTFWGSPQQIIYVVINNDWHEANTVGKLSAPPLEQFNELRLNKAVSEL